MKHTGINTEQTQCDRNIGTNPPKYTEEVTRAMDNENVTNDIAQVLVLYKILEILTGEGDRLLEETSTVDNPID
ncbi:unnamed protein product [Rotaria socialis]|uniref:Uncharacterized protein n=1 Tax=Rotaria socialis TaxID=392032 RepID=A0A818AHX0_9BILA|nr:unnamed protein product [Rotaria socialis]